MTPTEREEFEMVAKAAGIEYRYNDSTKAGPHFRRSDTGYSEWNPCTDDGDAFRLLVCIWKHFATMQFLRLSAALMQGNKAATREAIWQCALECARRGK